MLKLDCCFHKRLVDFSINNLDGRVVKASASGAVYSGVIPSRVKPVTVKLVFTAFLLDAHHKRTVWRTCPQVDLLCRRERHLSGFPHLRVVDRWPTTSKQAGYCVLIAFS